MSHSDEDALLAGNDALHSALSSIPGVSVMVFDRDLRIRSLHGSALERHGYVHEEMVGSLAADVLRPPAWQRLRPFFLQALAGETVTMRQRSDDDEAEYESTFSPVLGDGRILAGTMTSRDITAQAAAETALSEAKNQLQAILDHSPMAIYMRDVEQRWIITNHETCGILGMTAEELAGKRMADTLPPDVAKQLAENDLEVMRGGEPRSFDEFVPDARTGRVRNVWSLKFPVRNTAGEIVGLGGVSLDVTDRERANRELVAARALSERMFATALVGMLVARAEDDGTAKVVECNPAFARMLGSEPHDLVGSEGFDIVHPDDFPVRQRMLDDVLADGSGTGEIRFVHRAGHVIHVLAGAALTHGADDERLIVLQAVDISERKTLETRLRHHADHDALTDLYTRRRFQEELVREVVRARRSRRRGALLLLDLDGFKTVNDTLGHSAGDELLVSISRALRTTLRSGDVLARMGGDEFALILPDTDLAGARVIAGKLIAVVRTHGRVTRDGREARVTASIGVTSVNGERALDAAQLLIEADIAMYQAKDLGKNRISVFARAGTASAA